MANSLMQLVSDGNLSVVPLTIKFFEQSHIGVYIDDVALPTAGYSYVWSGATTITITPTVALGVEVSIRRRTPADYVLHDFQAGAVFSETSIDENFRQDLFLLQEAREQSLVTDLYSNLDMHGNKVRNLGDAVLGRDATPLSQVQRIIADSGGNPFAEAQLWAQVQRSCAAAEYNLVAGSFETGGALVGANDVLLHKASGRAFLGPAGIVVAGTSPTVPTFTPVDASFTFATYRKTNLTIQSGGTIVSGLDVVLDTVSGMWYEWTGGLPHTFVAAPATPTQVYSGWICRGLLSRWPVNDPRNFGAHSRYELGFIDFDSTDAIQLMVDAQRLSLPNAGANYTLDYTSRQSLDFDGMVYNVSRPISCQDDVVTGHRASGLKIHNGGLRALTGFTGQTQVKNSVGDTEVIKSFLIFGVKNYATQSGQWQGWTCVDNFSFDGNGFKVDDPIYLDVSAYGTYSNIKCRQIRRGWKSKVVFLSNFSNWQMTDCNGVYYMVNTSIADGYNGGLGLEGGGNTLDGLTITGDGDGDQSVNRLHQDRIGEITCSNVISYNGLGDFLTVTADTGSASGTKWSRWKGIEVGDLGGRVFNLRNASYLDIELTAVKCGRLLGNKALGLIDTCSYVHITPMVDQFYDLPSAWTSAIAFMDCVGCRVNDGTVRSIPHADNTSHLISFLGNCVDCSVGDITTNLGSYAKRYISPVHSDPTCVNTSVVGGTFLSGIFVSPTPDLRGAGDNYTGVNINGQVQDSPRMRRYLQAASGVIAATHFELQKVLPTVNVAGANLVTIDFTSAAVHNCSVDIELTGVTPSGSAAYAATYKVMFTRASSSVGVVTISPAGSPLTQSTTATTLGIAITETHTQFQVTLKALPTFGGASPEVACRIAAYIRVNSGKADVAIS